MSVMWDISKNGKHYSLYVQTVREILELFRSYKITSLTINGQLYDDYKDLPEHNEIYDLKINKKFLKYLRNTKFVIENFISDSERIIYQAKTKNYIKVNISYHARVRLLTRLICYFYTVNEDKLSKQMKSLIEYINEEFLSKLTDDDLVDAISIKNKIIQFVSDNEDTINSYIFALFKSARRHNAGSFIYSKRISKHGDSNYYIHGQVLFIYDIKSSTIKTVEIANRDNLRLRSLKSDINRKSSSYKFICSTIKQNLKSGKLLEYNKT